MSAARRPRVLFYVQHLLGIGHQARAAAIARAIQEAGLDVIYVTGGYAESARDLGGSEVVQLPPARTADAAFDTLVDGDGRPVDSAWEAARRDALLDTFARSGADVLLIESFPFGRRRFRFELLPLLEAAAGRIPIVASVRDILVQKDDPKRTKWIVDIVNRYFDRVIVHGDPTLIALGATFPGADAISDRLTYSGYVAPPAADRTDGARAGVAVSVGGGAVGGPILRASLAARPLTRLSKQPWRLITGPNLPESDRNAIFAAPGVTIDTFVKDFNRFLCTVGVSVSQAGYNTVMDLLTSRTKSVLIPFAREGETEQSLRARVFAERCAFQVLPETDLTPSALASAIEAALDAPPPDPSGFDLDGAAKTAQTVAELALAGPFSVVYKN